MSSEDDKSATEQWLKSFFEELETQYFALEKTREQVLMRRESLADTRDRLDHRKTFAHNEMIELTDKAVTKLGTARSLIHEAKLFLGSAAITARLYDDGFYEKDRRSAK